MPSNPADQEPEPELYVQFPNDYIAPAQYIRNRVGQIRKSGNYIMVLLWPAAPRHRINWAQWIHVDQELFTDEVYTESEQP